MLEQPARESVQYLVKRLARVEQISPPDVAFVSIGGDNPPFKVDSQTHKITVDLSSRLVHSTIIEEIAYCIALVNHLNKGNLTVDLTNGVYSWHGDTFDFEDVEEEDVFPWEQEIHSEAQRTIKSMKVLPAI